MDPMSASLVCIHGLVEPSLMSGFFSCSGTSPETLDAMIAIHVVSMHVRAMPKLVRASGER